MVLLVMKNLPYLSVGWFWYLGTLVPVIGIIQVGEQSMADRYTYIPLIGIFLMIVWGLENLISSWHYKKSVIADGFHFSPIKLIFLLLYRSAIANPKVSHANACSSAMNIESKNVANR